MIAARASSTETVLGDRVVELTTTGELDAEVEALGDDAGDGQHQRGAGDAEPHAALAHDVEVGPVEPLADPADVAEAADRRDDCSTALVETLISASTRAMISAEIIEAMTPMESVTPKPLIGPEPRMNSSAAASRVVTLESMMADQALLKPTARARRRPAEGYAAYSSRARSKTSTLASIAMPIASTKPARPGRVRVESEREQHRVGQQGVRRQRDRGHRADEPVDEHDEETGEDQTDDAGLDRGVDRPLTERRPDEPVGDQLELEGQRATLDERRQVVRARSAVKSPEIVGAVVGDVGAAADT